MERLFKQDNERLSSRTQAETKGATWPVFVESGWTGPESGLMAPVHPLGGQFVSRNSALREFAVRNCSPTRCEQTGPIELSLKKVR